MVRCKFICISKSSMSPNNDDFCLGLAAVTTGSEENKRFFNTTPAGNLELQIVNEEVAKQFESGKEYYIDISQA